MNTATAPEDARILRKVAWRLIPFLCLLYFFAFLDRVNVGFAALTMNADLGFSATLFGHAAGIFFLGYVLFEVPSNLLMYRIGARRTISRIMVIWGLLSAGTAFVTAPWQLLTVRFLLGVAEAGFFPGMILYLTQWFPAEQRGRIIAAFMIALPLASVIGAPLSSALLDLSAAGLRGWQWLFLLEGLPTVLAGICVLWWLPDTPADARWLTAAERERWQTVLDRGSVPAHADHSAAAGLRTPAVWGLGLTYLCLLVGLYGYGFWLPQLMAQLGSFTHLQVGLMTMVPNLLAALGMYFWARRATIGGRRRSIVLLPTLLGAAGLFVATFALHQSVAVYLGLCVAAVGIYAALPLFWTIPTSLLRGAAAASGIALVNSIGNLGGYLGSSLMGYLRDVTGRHEMGLQVLAASIVLGGLSAAVLVHRTAGAQRPR